MNPRVLELIKNPELFQNQDLDLLNLEIKKHPYIQNIRALYLLGIHKYSSENYQKVLSTTAAYTTDKKILYQFINKKITAENTQQPVLQKKKEPFSEVRKKSFPITPSQDPKAVLNDSEKSPVDEPKPVYVNGILNRILFEGEENFLEQENEVIDLESTLESGKIVTQAIEKEPVKNITETENPEASITAEPEISENFTPETVITETDISNEENTVEENTVEENSESSFHGIEEFLSETKVETELNTEEITSENKTVENIETVNQLPSAKEEPVIENPAEVSFHGMDDFLPQVKINPNTSELKSYKVPKPALSRHEEEMQRLIAEVEAKMKSSKKEKVEDEEIPQNRDVNFFETQNFEVPKQSEGISAPDRAENTDQKENIQENDKKPAETSKISDETEIKPATEKSGWKPMSFSGNTPDSFIEKTEVKSEGKIVPVEKEIIQPETVSETQEKTEDRPVFNVSFFTQKVSPIVSEKVEKPAEEILNTEEIIPENEDSNIPTFINTWQKWLKIDRSESKNNENIPVSKEKVIEDFIVKEPKISKLKEESDFVVKEKGDNISHLMTETLANLYTEQKLYTKAIKAYQILSEKHPGKKDYFEEKINQIKDLRQNK